MTTIIGFKGYDPEMKKEYVLLAGDSRGTYLDKNGTITTKFSNVGEKILWSRNHDYFIGYSGNALEKNSQKGKNLEEKISNLVELENPSSKKIEEKLEEINKCNPNNQYFFTTICDGKPFFNFYDSKLGLKEKISHGIIGSGMLYNENAKIKNPNGTLNKDANLIEVNLDDGIRYSLEKLNKISNFDKMTGGYMGIAVLVDKKTSLYDPFFIEISNTLNQEKIIEQYLNAERKFMKKAGLEGKKIRELLLLNSLNL